MEEKCGNCRYFTKNCKDYNGNDACIYEMNDTDKDDNACVFYERFSEETI